MSDIADNNGLQATLDTLLKIHDAALRDYNQKRAEVSRIQTELSQAGKTIDSLSGTIRIIQAQLGVAEDERIPSSNNGQSTDRKTVTQTVLEVIGEHDARGGIAYQDILSIARRKGVESAEDYLKAVFYRLQHRDKKIVNIDKRWQLTDKGRTYLTTI